MLPNLSALTLRCREVGAVGDSDEEDPLQELLRKQGARKLELLRREAKLADERRPKSGARNRRPRDVVPLAPPVPVPPASAPEDPDDPGDGYRTKKRALLRPSAWREDHMLDFSFENPLDGKFKDLPVVQELIKDYPALVRRVGTSYCHYGYDYRKRTVFVSSLTNFQPTPPCPGTPCSWIRSGLEHPGSVQGCARDQKNSLPPALIDLLINSWRSRHAGKAAAYLLVDVFSGWGSVDTRVEEKQRLGEWQDVRVYSNDIVQRDHTDVTLDMSADSMWSPAALLAFAVDRHWPGDVGERMSHPGGLIGWLNAKKIAVLFHCSTPCDTYSTNGLGYHRVGKTLEPKTPMAKAHDAMNASLIGYFKRTVLSQPPPIAATTYRTST